VRDAEKFKVATLITEFGAWVPDAKHPEGQGADEIERVLDEADATLQGWTYWDIVGLVDRKRGGFRASAIDPFVRPYASAIAGVPQHMSFRRETGVFKLVFEPNSNIPEPTEIMVPTVLYPNGYTVVLTEGLKIVPCSQKGMVCVIAGDIVNGKVSTIIIHPKGGIQRVLV